MKSVYKKVSVIALSSMIIAGGIASSGINAQAYSPDLKHQIEDLRRGAGIYHEVKHIANGLGSKVEAVFVHNEDMNRYVSDNYWDNINRKSSSSEKSKKDLSKGVDCGNNAVKLESEIKKRELGDVFRVRYKGLNFLVRRIKYKSLSEIPSISGSDIERNLGRENQRLYRKHIEDKIKNAGFKVVKISEYNNKDSRKGMEKYIKERFKDGVFKGNEDFEEGLLVGLGCNDYESLMISLKHPEGDVMRLIYSNIDMLLVRDN